MAFDNAIRRNLAETPAHLFCAQEMSEAHEDLLKTAGWVSSGRREGLCVFGKKPIAVRVELLANDVVIVGSAPKISKAMFARVHWHPSQRLIGETSVVVCSMRLHNEHAKERTKNYLDFVGQMCAKFATLRCRILCGDANMRCYDLVPALAGLNVTASLVACHCEFERTLDQKQVTELLLHDSMGIWVLGPVARVRRVKPEIHIVAGAVHPKLLDGKKYLCGYQASSYRGQRPEQPEDIDELWEMAQKQLGECMACEASADTKHTVWDLTDERRRVVANILSDEKAKGNYFIEICPEDDVVRDPRVPALAGVEGVVRMPTIGKVEEKLAGSLDMDPDGYLWGRGGHWPLFAVLGLGRDRSKRAYEDRTAREEKNKIYRTSGTWPWWIPHDSEKGFWCAKDQYMVGQDGRGQGYKGVLWRMIRDQYPEAEVEEYERPWVERYGADALEKALEFTEPYYQEARRQGLTVQDLQQDPDHAHFFEPRP